MYCVCVFVYAGAVSSAAGKRVSLGLRYADVYDVCCRMLTYADVCCHMLTYAAVC
jgi:hypothetical protein